MRGSRTRGPAAQYNRMTCRDPAGSGRGDRKAPAAAPHRQGRPVSQRAHAAATVVGHARRLRSVDNHGTQERQATPQMRTGDSARRPRVSRCTATVPYRRDQFYCGSGLGAQHPGQSQRAVTDPRWRLRHRELLCSAVFPTDYGECALHLRGLPARTKVQELHRYWFETGIPIAIDLEEIRL